MLHVIAATLSLLLLAGMFGRSLDEQEGSASEATTPAESEAISSVDQTT